MTNNDEIWEGRGQKIYNDFTRHPIRTLLFWFGVILVVLFAFTLIANGCGIIGGYTNEAARVVGVGNVKEQNAAIIKDWEGMTSIATISCRIDAEGLKGGNADAPNGVLESPSVSYAVQYEEPRQDYDRRIQDLYKAQVVRKLALPSNLRSYPEQAPTLEEMKAGSSTGDHQWSKPAGC